MLVVVPWLVTVTCIAPVFNPWQSTSVTDTLIVGLVSDWMVTVLVAVQVLASVTVTLYVPPSRLSIVAVLPELFHS